VASPRGAAGKLAQAWQRSAGYIHTPTSPWFQIHSDMIQVMMPYHGMLLSRT
jgi:hypothetical protein